MDDLVPLWISLSGKRVTVFGGGEVAFRKCEYLKNTDITVIAESISPRFSDINISRSIKKVSPADIEGLIKGSDMVVAATDDKGMNDSIRQVSISCGIPVNSAHGGGDILIPSVLRRDRYTVAVSSEGRVPAFPPFMIEELDRILDGRYDRMLDLMVEIRSEYSDKWDQRKRSEFYRKVLRDTEISELVSNGDMGRALARARKMGESV